MQYRSLFSLTIRHDFYHNGECPDFTVAPTPECVRLLQSYRLLGRPAPTGFQVLTSLNKNDATQPFFTLPKGLTFSFLLYLKNPKFVNFTDLDASFDTHLKGKPVLYFNEIFQSQTDVFDLKEDGTQVGAERHFTLTKAPLPDTVIGTGDTQIRITKNLSSGNKSLDLVDFDKVNNKIHIKTNTILTGEFEVKYPVVPNMLVARDGSLKTETFNVEDGLSKDGKWLFVLTEELKPDAAIADISLGNQAFTLSAIDPDTNTIEVDTHEIHTGSFSVTYPVGTWLRTDCFARVDIQILDPVVFSNIIHANPANDFEIRFRAKSFYWKCCAVALKANTGNKKSFAFFDNDSNKVGHRQNNRMLETRLEIFNDFTNKLAPLQEGEKKAGLQEFQTQLTELEARSTLKDYQTRFFVFSDKKIPCREKYAALPKIKVNIEDVDPKKHYDLILTAPPDNVDVIRIIPID